MREVTPKPCSLVHCSTHSVVATQLPHPRSATDADSDIHYPLRNLYGENEREREQSPEDASTAKRSSRHACSVQCAVCSVHSAVCILGPHVSHSTRSSSCASDLQREENADWSLDGLHDSKILCVLLVVRR